MLSPDQREMGKYYFSVRILLAWHCYETFLVLMNCLQDFEDKHCGYITSYRWASPQENPSSGGMRTKAQTSLHIRAV